MFFGDHCWVPGRSAWANICVVPFLANHLSQFSMYTTQQAHHNMAEREHELGTQYLQEQHSGWKYWDAGLTAKGVDQCTKLRRE